MVGRKIAVNASRDVWTPTMPVYRAKGKNGSADSLGTCVGGLVADGSAVLTLREGIFDVECKRVSCSM